jgi:muconolactone delta-isomerase
VNARVADGVAAHVTTSLRGEGTMPVYLVERALPGVTLAQLTAIRRAGEEMCHRFTRDGKAVHYRRSIFVPGESRCLCLFDAQDGDRVQEVNEAAQIPYGRIVLAVDLT